MKFIYIFSQTYRYLPKQYQWNYYEDIYVLKKNSFEFSILIYLIFKLSTNQQDLWISYIWISTYFLCKSKIQNHWFYL